MIVFIRHAERGDNELPQLLSEILHDPPIIPSSHKTISQAVAQLITILQQHQINKVRIISSKFLRCLMTAKEFYEKLKKQGYEIKQEWQLSNGIIQYLRPDWFSQNPVQKPLIYQTSNIHKYIPSNTVKLQQPNKHTIEKFPQSYVDFHYRIEKFRENLKSPPPGECLLVFTHGFVVREICWRSDYFPSYEKQIKYCGYVVFKIEDSKHVLYKTRL